MVYLLNLEILKRMYVLSFVSGIYSFSKKQPTKTLSESDSDTETNEVSSKYLNKLSNKLHSSINEKNKYKYYDPYRVEVNLIDFSNLHLF